jgi:hypothetical protein
MAGFCAHDSPSQISKGFTNPQFISGKRAASKEAGTVGDLPANLFTTKGTKVHEGKPGSTTKDTKVHEGKPLLNHEGHEGKPWLNHQGHKGSRREALAERNPLLKQIVWK